MTKGSLVLYKDQPAIIQGIQNDKFEIELPKGVKKVREKDLLFFHAGPVNRLADILNAPLSDPAILADVREFFDGDTPSLTDIAELILGSYTAADLWGLWRLLQDTPQFETSRADKPIRIRTAAEAAEYAAKEQEKAALEKNREEAVVLLKAAKSGKQVTLKPCHTPFLQEIEAFALGLSGHSKMLSYAHVKETPEEAHRLLLKTGFWTVDKNPHPSRNNLSMHSSRAVISEPIFKTPELDLTHILSFAIDDPWSTDPDDAVCYDGTHVWIHVASPADTILPDSPADIDARSRGATLYLPEGAARMLEHKSIDFFALGRTEISHALSFCITLSETGEIEQASVHRTRIRVQCISYTQADTDRHSPALAPLFDIAHKNYTRRHNAGAISIEMPEVHISLDEKDGKKQPHITPVTKTASSAMVKEMMLLAGEAAAYIAFKENIPFPFISQERPDMPKNLPDGLAGEYKKRSVMRPRSVGTSASAHAGLGLSMYSQVTSPLRRYPDLIAHAQLLAFLDHRPPISADDVLMRISAADMALQKTKKAERASRRHWTLVFLLAQREWQAEAVVLDTRNNTARIAITGLGIETDIHVKHPPNLNETCTVRIQSLDLPNLDVKFTLVTP